MRTNHIYIGWVSQVMNSRIGSTCKGNKFTAFKWLKNSIYWWWEGKTSPSSLISESRLSVAILKCIAVVSWGKENTCLPMISLTAVGRLSLRWNTFWRNPTTQSFYWQWLTCKEYFSSEFEHLIISRYIRWCKLRRLESNKLNLWITIWVLQYWCA